MKSIMPPVMQPSAVAGERNDSRSFHHALNELQAEIRTKSAEWHRRLNALRREVPLSSQEQGERK